MIRTLSLACAAAMLLTGPAMAQKFLSVTGDSSRMTVGEIAARDAEAATGTQEAAIEPDAVEDQPIPDPADAAQAEEAGETAEEEPAVAEAEAAPARETARVTGPCGIGAFWDTGTRTCRSF
jgi:hypothetical protein